MPQCQTEKFTFSLRLDEELDEADAAASAIGLKPTLGENEFNVGNGGRYLGKWLKLLKPFKSKGIGGKDLIGIELGEIVGKCGKATASNTVPKISAIGANTIPISKLRIAIKPTAKNSNITTKNTLTSNPHLA